MEDKMAVISITELKSNLFDLYCERIIEAKDETDESIICSEMITAKNIIGMIEDIDRGLV